MQTGRYHFGIIEYHDGFLRQKLRQVAEDILPDFPVFVMQQLGCIPFFKGIFRYPGIVQAIIVVFDMDFRNHQNRKFYAKLHYLSGFGKSRGENPFPCVDVYKYELILLVVVFNFVKTCSRDEICFNRAAKTI